MEIYPAIDLKGGRVVRWLEGEHVRETHYSDDPVNQATAFCDEGARWIHVVDIDRAFATGHDNMEAVAALVALPGLHVQLGGNVHTPEWADDATRVGADRVVLGTSAAADADRFADLVTILGPGRAALAVDTRNSALAVRGSDHALPMTVEQVVELAMSFDVDTFVYRDLARDGLLTGANIDEARKVARLGGNVIVAGGVSGLEDVRRAADAGIDGVIIGRALYESRLTVREAIECCS